MIRYCLNRIRFDEWVGTVSGRPTMWTRDLLRCWGWRVSLHCLVSEDDRDCFHTHPATALRVILSGGYIEELEGGETRVWATGMAGIVRPELSHRISFLAVNTYTLWVRAPKTAAIELRGSGWKREGAA